jgi:hypothetical protein
MPLCGAVARRAPRQRAAQSGCSGRPRPISLPDGRDAGRGHCRGQYRGVERHADAFISLLTAPLDRMVQCACSLLL